MKFSKSTLPELVLSIVGILISVAGFVLIQIAGKVYDFTTLATPLAVLELIISILFLTALSANKPVFARVISIITYALLIVTFFVVTIVCAEKFRSELITWDSISFLTISIVTLVAVVLAFIYDLVGKTPLLRSLSKIISYFAIGLTALFTIILCLSSFIGTFKTRPLYGIELAVLLVFTVLVLIILSLLQTNISKEPKEQQA